MGAKKALMFLGIIVALIVIAATVIALLFDINSYKPRIETAASKATSLNVRINGNIGFSLFPLGVSVNDVQIADKMGEILSLNKLKIGVELIPLLKKQIKVTSCELVKPVITIVKDDEGKYNFENSEKKSTKEGQGTAFSFKELILSQGILVYADKKSGEKTEAKDINLAIYDLLVGDRSGSIIKKISFRGNIDCKEVRKKDFKIDNIKSSIKMENGVIYFIPLTMDIFGGKGEGEATVDESGVDAVYKINFKISNLDFAKIKESFGTKKVLGGKGDLYTSLMINEKENRKMISSMSGTFSLQGDNIVTYTMDLDKVLSKIETSQEVSLVNLGAFFIAGPIGTAAIQGYRYGDLYAQTQEGEGIIKHFISRWEIKDGVADAMDCALATQHNRIALKGKLNLVSERYDNIIVALLDDKGCAKFQQSISGSFSNPHIDKVSAAESLAGPIINIFKKVKGIVQKGKCEVFYNGSVRQP